MKQTIAGTSIGKRIRLVFSRPRGPAPLPIAPLVDPANGLVEFVAYAEDCVLTGYIELDAERLSDLLNAHEQFELRDILVEDLAESGAFRLANLALTRDELLLVHATGPRGEPNRRIRTRQHPVGMRIGPFDVRGYIHATPGADPIVGFRRRKTMVPITDAWIEYTSGGVHHRRRVGTVVVNRQRVDWIVPAIDDEVEMPDLPLSAFPKGPLLKDFTEQVLAR